MFLALRRAWHLRDTARRVRRHGWTGICVGDYHTAPSWAYTVGFRETLGAPEIIVFDLPPTSANELFHEIFRQLGAGELVLRDGESWGDPPGRAVWRRVHPSRVCDAENPWLGGAVDHAGLSAEPGALQAFQLVLSDEGGRLPWETGYDERLRPRQRALYLAAEEAADTSGPPQH
jgi:hypothetical protein